MATCIAEKKYHINTGCLKKLVTNSFCKVGFYMAVKLANLQMCSVIDVGRHQVSCYSLVSKEAGMMSDIFY